MLFIYLCSLSDDERNLVEAIFKENQTKFYNVAYSYLKSDAGAKDAVSESMIKVIKNISKISSLLCPQRNAFCVTIVRNTSLDMLRKEKHFVLVDNDELERKVDETSPFDFPDDNIEVLLSAQTKLSDDERKLVYLKYGYNKSFKEIASIFNISEETAKKRGQRILAKLKDLYEKEAIL